MAPAPVRIHQRIAGEIFMALNQSMQKDCALCEVLYEVDWKVNEEIDLKDKKGVIC